MKRQIAILAVVVLSLGAAPGQSVRDFTERPAEDTDWFLGMNSGQTDESKVRKHEALQRPVTQAGNGLALWDGVVWTSTSTWRKAAANEIPDALVSKAGDPSFRVTGIRGHVVLGNTGAWTPGMKIYWDTGAAALTLIEGSSTIPWLRVLTTGQEGRVQFIGGGSGGGGLLQPAPLVLTTADQVPDVRGFDYVVLDNSTNTTVTVTGFQGTPYQRFYLQGANTTLEHNRQILIERGLNFALAMDSVQSFVFDETGTIATQVAPDQTETLNRQNHTGTQLQSTVENLPETLSALQASLADTESTDDLNTRQAAAQNRANHTGKDTIADISGLQASLDLKAEIANLEAVFASYIGTSPEGVDALNDLAAGLATDPDLENLLVKLEPKKNFIKAAYFQAGKYFSPAAGQISLSSSFRSAGWIPVEAGQEYTVSGIEVGNLCVSATGPNDTGETYIQVGSTAAPTFTIPAGHTHLWINMTNDGESVTTYDGTIQLEKGPDATAYEPYSLAINIDSLSQDIGPAISIASDSSLIPRMETVTGKNLLDPSKVDFLQRYSTGTGSAQTDTLGIAAYLIEVTAGETYSVSGEAIYGGTSTPQGGYYTNSTYINTTSVSNITWVDATGGHTFTVPTGQNITHALISLRKLGDVSTGTSLQGAGQIELAALPSAYEAYNERLAVAEANLPDSALQVGGGTSTPTNTTINDETWYKYVEGEPSPSNRDKWPLFRTKYLKKQQNVVVVSTGTSLTARSTEHHTDHPDASTRPPLMHSNNLATHIWDRLKWDGQHYARYDKTGAGSETAGTWITNHNEAEWDDGLYRNGLTRYSDSSGATFSREVPAGAYAWRLIYRTDSVASEDVLVTVTGGNDRMQVYDEGTDTWVEANAYSFSQRESAPVLRDVPVPKPDLGNFVTRNISTKSNTTYQKRLKFRTKFTGADTRAIAKTVTFTANGAGRLLYWGHEWSRRPAMITYINAARGSHNTQAETSNGLPRFADNEVHGFEPDLIYMEIPIHNDGASGATAYPTHDRWERLVNDYVFRQDYELSLKARAADLGYTVPEIGMWTPSIAGNFNGLDPDGEFVFSDNSDGVVNNALDRFDWAQAWVMDNHPEAVFVNSVRRWVDAGRAIYGDLATATAASGKSGPTMTNDGSHQNDIGSAILAKVVVGPFCYWQ